MYTITCGLKKNIKKYLNNFRLLRYFVHEIIFTGKFSLVASTG